MKKITVLFILFNSLSNSIVTISGNSDLIWSPNKASGHFDFPRFQLYDYGETDRFLYIILSRVLIYDFEKLKSF